tara:strand:- start:201 stop:443 length:243 start_codon:yes stop_codon:yes gene_type:complete
MDYKFIDNGAEPVRFIACYLEVLKEENPALHEKICAKQREIIKGIEPNSCRGPTIMDMINDVLQKADKERFYQIKERLSK